MSSASHVLVVRAEVPADIEAAWNDWYDRVHLPEIAACPGFRSGRRFSAEAAGSTGQEQRRYLAIYEIEGPHVLESAEFKQRRGWGPFTGRVQYETVVYGPIPPAGR